MTQTSRLAGTAAPTTLERELLARWSEEDLFERAQDAHARTARPSCSTRVRRPPTAARASTTSSRAPIKDLICRFRAMQGRQVTRIAGWDTHGLPVEIEVEKELKLNGKKAIEEYGVARVQREGAARASSRYQSRLGGALRTASATGSTTSTPTSPAATSTSSRSGGCCSGCTRRTCSIAATGCCRTARAAARCSRATSWRWATRRSRTSRST